MDGCSAGLCSEWLPSRRRPIAPSDGCGAPLPTALAPSHGAWWKHPRAPSIRALQALLRQRQQQEEGRTEGGRKAVEGEERRLQRLLRQRSARGGQREAEASLDGREAVGGEASSSSSSRRRTRRRGRVEGSSPEAGDGRRDAGDSISSANCIRVTEANDRTNAKCLTPVCEITGDIILCGRGAERGGGGGGGGGGATGGGLPLLELLGPCAWCN